MRIAFVVTGLGMGGAEVQVCTLAAGFSQRGATVEIISMIPFVADHPQLSARSIPVVMLGMKRGRSSPADLFRYIKAIRKYRPDVVHSHMFHANLLARLGRPFSGAPLVCTAHNTDERPERGRGGATRGRLRELAYRLSDPLCNLTTQVSEAGAERYVAIGATPAAKMRFMPNAVDSQRFHPDPTLRQQIRRELGLGDTFTWIAVGRIEEQKDPWTLLEAFRVASASHPCVLLVAGSGSLEQEMRNRATALGVAAKVRFLGLRRDVPALLNGADAYVLSSSYEGFPMVLLEASVSGLPLVITSAAPEALIPDKTGWLVNTRDPNALAERMSAMMALPTEKRRAMGEAGRSFVISKFSLDPILDNWERVYGSLLRNGRLEAHVPVQ